MNDADRIREQRKHEHIEAVRTLPELGGSGLEDVTLLPWTASEVDLAEVSLATEVLGHPVRSPVVLNAMTGGTEEARRINGRLARLARRHGLALAVGSESAALRDGRRAGSYTVARTENPDGVLMANVGMGTLPDAAQRAIDLIGADILQVHWNTAQELFMREGDRTFRGMLDALAEICRRLSVPVVAKEVGQGMAAGAARRFAECGVQGIDVGGRGGTNFMAVEAWRAGVDLDPEWRTWGLPTAYSLAEVLAVAAGDLAVFASGGIRTGHDVAKCLALGACATGVAGPLMRLAADPEAGEGEDDVDRRLDAWVERVHETLRKILVLTGAPDLETLRQRPVVVTGRAREWLEIRGYGDFVTTVARRA